MGGSGRGACFFISNSTTTTRFIIPKSPTLKYSMSINKSKSKTTLVLVLPQPQSLKSCSLNNQILCKFKLNSTTRCFFDESNQLVHFDSEEKIVDSVSRSNHNAAALIAMATLTSKILGLIREITLASVFGMGPVVTAYKHASVLPVFCLSVLGGVNGPIHLTMATTLSKLSKERGRKLFQNTKVLMFLIGGIVGAFILKFAESIIYASSPGLWVLAERQISRKLAIGQLKFMIPCVVFSGPLGLGFGYFSAAGDNFLACISPALSSFWIIASCLGYVSMRKAASYYLDGVLFGGLVISCGASLGVISQWLMQVVVHEKGGHDCISVSWLNILKDRDVHEFFLLMLTATLTSGMAQLASLTDLYFASFIPAAAAGLSYAHLIVMAPLGILSSVIIMPLLPTFSELAKPPRWPKLVEKLKQVIMLCMVIVLPITSTMCVLADPVISILFQWSTCDSNASALVSSLVLCYSIGSPFYIIRELLVMVFYALGDSQQPSLISMAAIILNAFLDWLFVSRFCLGAQGLALSTSLVTSLSTLVLFHLLSRKLSGLVDTTTLVGSLLQLVVCCIISGCTTSVIYNILRYLSSATLFIRFSFLKELLSIFLAGSLGICSFLLLAFLRFPELKHKGPFKTFITR